ncbi:futalosine hydrolase, partial [Actinomadura logoneensis]
MGSTTVRRLTAAGTASGAVLIGSLAAGAGPASASAGPPSTVPLGASAAGAS